MSTTNVYVCSKMRDNGYPHDFNINMYGLWSGDDSQNVSVDGWSIPHISPNIKTGWNDTLTIILSGKNSNNETFVLNTKLTIPQGSWTLDKLTELFIATPINNLDFTTANASFYKDAAGGNHSTAEFVAKFPSLVYDGTTSGLTGRPIHLALIPEYLTSTNFMESVRYRLFCVYSKNRQCTMSSGTISAVSPTITSFTCSLVIADDIGKRLWERMGIPFTDYTYTPLSVDEADVEGYFYSTDYTSDSVGVRLPGTRRIVRKLIPDLNTLWLRYFTDPSTLLSPQLAIQYVDICTQMSTQTYSNDRALPSVLKRVWVGNTPIGDYLKVSAEYEQPSVLNVDSNSTLRLRLFLRSDDGSAYELPFQSHVAYHITISSAAS